MDFLNASFKIGRLFEIDIRVHIFFVIFAAFRLINSRDPEYTIFFITLLFGIVLAHEFGHCFGARAVGGDADQILMWPLGGLAYIHAPMRPWNQFVAVAAGPLVNVVFCLAVMLAFFVMLGDATWLPLHPFASLGNTPEGFDERGLHWYLRVFYHVNLFLLFFNLLPIFPMDGGRLFQIGLWKFLGLREATIVACKFGIAGAVAMLVFWVWNLQQGGMGLSVLPLIAMFGGFSSYQMLQAAQQGYLQEDDPWHASAQDYRYRGGTLIERMLKLKPRERKPREAPRSAATNPNPGGWDRKQRELEKLDAEVDRILQKVSDQGRQSLTYAEEQTLRRATKMRQQRG